MTKNTWVVIATFNERENIVKLIGTILSLPGNISVAIVDDNSPDGTAEAINESFGDNPRVNLIVRNNDPGYGKSMIEGFKNLLEKGAEKIITMDADWSHDPNEVPNLLKALDNSSVALGSRYKGGARVLNWPLRRLLLSIFANKYARTIMGVDIVDCTSGFRAYRKDFLESVNWDKVKTTGYAFLVEVLYRAYKKRFSIVEVPIVYTERREGQSKMSNWVIWESVWVPWKLRLKIMR